MTRILIEHPGTEYYNSMSQDMVDLLEYEFGLDPEVAIGDSEDPMTLYTEDGLRIAQFTSLPSREALRLYISLAT